MGRRRRAKAKKHRPPDPADVLAGKVEIRPEELFDLIHRVNPTGQELLRPEKNRRYAVKARLQSLLIRRFGDRHVTVRESEQDGVVSLVHRSGARDACHAVLSEMDPEARAWIQLQLDLEASGDSEDGGPEQRGGDSFAMDQMAKQDRTAGAAELLRRGADAIHDFDYEAAEGHLRLALERGGGADAAQALLDLLVGLLGMDRQALDIEPRLASEARAHPGVRALLALAAARLGEKERALELAARTSGPPAAEVHVALAALAIQDLDSEDAALHLEAATGHDPTHPRLLSLADEIAALRAESQRPAEEALERRRREEGSVAAEDDARTLLGQWPESEVARRILREVAAHRRAEKIAKHLEQGEKALGDKRFNDAAAQLQAALDAGSERADLPTLIERARARERRQQETARLDRAVDRFSSADLKPALLGYLSLPEALREQARERVDRPALGWLEETGVPRSGAKAQAAVSAVLALERAIGELRDGRAQAALDELSAHEHALANVGEARRCLRAARAQVAAGRRDRARKALEAAREAFDAARLERAQELLEGAELDQLAARDRQAAEDLLAAIRHSEEVRRLEHEVERHLESEDLLGALERAGQLVELAAEPGERKRWRRRAGELQGRIRSAWRLEIEDGEAPLDELRDFSLDAFDDTPRYWLDDDGRKLVLAAAWDDRLFIRVVDVESGCVVTRVSLKTPEPLGRDLATCLDGDRLWIAGLRGGVLELEAGTWDVLCWRSLGELLPTGAIIETVVLLPRGLFLWLRVRVSPDSWQLWVVDLRAWRVSRKLPEASTVLPIAGPGEPRVMVSDYRHGTRLHTARGTSESTEPLRGGHVYCAAISPDGEGLVLAVQRPRPDGKPIPEWVEGDDPDWVEDDEPGLVLLLAADSEHGEATDYTSGVGLDDAFLDGANSIATSLDDGVSYALVQYGESERELLTLAIPEQTFDVLYQEEVPLETVLVQDRRSRHGAALMAGEYFFDVVPLGAGRPQITAVPEPRERFDDLLPIVGKTSFCGNPTGADNARILATMGSWREMPAPDLKRHVETQEKKHAGDPDELVHLCLTLKHRTDLEAERERIIRRSAQRYPRHGGTALLMADLEAQADNWPEVARLLGEAELGDLEDDDGRQCHFHHLLGLAALHDGRADEAFEAFEKGSRFERGTCMLQPLVHMTRPMSDPPDPHEHNPDQPAVRQLLGAIRLADRALAAGDPASALAALDRRAVWHGAELQSAARLAAAYLETSTSDPGERFRKTLALALFQHVYQARKQALVEIFLPGLNWDEDRLAEVAKRARAWLEGSG